MELYEHFCESFVTQGCDVNSDQFLSNFTYGFLTHEDNEVSQTVYEAAAKGWKETLDRNREVFFSNSAGGDVPFYVCLAIEDFLNYAIPRTIGLVDAKERFEALYQRFDSDFFGEECTVTTFAILSNVWDHGRRVVLPETFRLRYLIKPYSKVDHPWEREKVIPFFEINRSAHAIGYGRPIGDMNAYFVLEHTHKLPKNERLFRAAWELCDDVARKFTFAVRLINYSACFSDYRGVRMLGHLSSMHSNVMNFPENALNSRNSSELNDADNLWLEILLPQLLQMDYASVFILDQKIQDAIGRERERIRDRQLGSRRVAVDQLMDYYQMLEAVLDVRGSEQTALYAAVLLAANGNGQFKDKGHENYTFLKETAKIRNDVVHGRLGSVLAPKDGVFKLDINRFRHIVHVLASLFVLNGPLRDAATKLAVGERVGLQSLYEKPKARTPQEFVEDRKHAIEARKRVFEGW
ncbi:MAG: hypothetical protein WBE86_09505 [Candidatus Acidiferrales bacterium]